jgi:hypothetical protein
MTSRDHDFIADRYVNIKDPNAEFREIPFYERKNIFDGTTPTECLICIEAENENYTKYAHHKAHLEAHTKANTIAEQASIDQDIIVDYMYRYLFFYGKEYKRLYFELYKKYREEYYNTLLEKTYEYGQVCQHHSESIIYHYEFKNKEN